MTLNLPLVKLERGSIAPVGLLATALLLTASLLLLCASALFQQQRRLNHLADAIALSSAQKVAKSKSEGLDFQLFAQAELKWMDNARTNDVWLQEFNVAANGVVALRLCQPAHLDWLVVPELLASAVIKPVCANARAGQLY